MNLLGDTPVSPAMQKGMAIMGALLTRAAEEASPSDDTPHLITFEEKVGMLGEVAPKALQALGK